MARSVRKQTWGRHGDLQGGYLSSRGMVVELGGVNIIDLSDYLETRPFTDVARSAVKATYGPTVSMTVSGVGVPSLHTLGTFRARALQDSRAGAFIVRR